MLFFWRKPFIKREQASQAATSLFYVLEKSQPKWFIESVWYVCMKDIKLWLIDILEWTLDDTKKFHKDSRCVEVWLHKKPENDIKLPLEENWVKIIYTKKKRNNFINEIL